MSSKPANGQQLVTAHTPGVEQLYQQAIEAAGAVAYSLDYKTDTYTFIGAGIAEMTGYSAAEITPSLWRSLHRETILGEEAAGFSLEEARKMARAGQLRRWQGDYRIETRFGRNRWINNAAVILIDEADDSVRSVGILIDITDRKEAEQALARQAAELQILNRRLTRQGWDDFLMTEPADAQFASAPPGEKSAAYSEQESGGNLSQPLAVRGEPIGQLTVNAPQELPDEAAEIVAEVAERLSTHLESLRLTRQTEAALARIEDQAQRLAHLSALGAELNAATRLVEVFDLLATRARDIIAHDQMSLALLNPQRTALDLYDGLELQTSQPPSQIIPLVGTLLGAVVSSGRMKHIFDLPAGDYGELQHYEAQGVREIISAPLVTGGTTLGAIILGRREAPAFDDQDEIMSQQVASLLATAIESQRLLAQTQARAERERQVRAAVDRVRQATDQEDILRVAREELSRMLGAREAVVRLKE